MYKSVGKLQIALDVYLPPNASSTSKIPVLVWYHGGGLLQGHRNQITAHTRKAATTYNVAVVSADYRFAPQVGIAEILEDVQDSIAFVRSKLASQLDNGDAIDATRLAVSGSSAGGYLAILAGLYMDPKPNVILPIYPITDPLGHFFTNPQPPAMGRELKAREVVAEFMNPEAEVVANNEADSARGNMYLHMQHDANLAKLWKVPEDKEGAKKWRLSRNVYEKGICPGYFLHGKCGDA